MTNSKHTGKVLVLGADFKNYRSCLTIIRSLGRYNLQVHIGWYQASDAALHSRYVSKAHDIPSYSPDDDAWKTELTTLIEKEKYDLVVPVNEQASKPLEEHRQEFEKYPGVYLLNKKAYDIAFNKIKTGELAKMLNICIPNERKVKDLSQIDAIIDEFKFPVVLKPTASFGLKNLQKKLYVYKAYSRDELKTILNHLLYYGDVLAQENFIGTGVGIEFIASQGKILFAFEHIRIHEPLMGGGSSYRKSASPHPELLEASKKLIKEMDYTGVGMAEFKYNFKTGKWIFLEINGRFWGSLPLAAAAGADFPRFLYQMRVENKSDFNQSFKTNLYCRNTIRDFEWIVQNITANKSDPSKNTLPNYRVFAEIFNVLSLRERNDTWVIDDPMPGMRELGRLIIVAAKIIRSALIDYMPWRWYRSYKARRMIYKAKSVLFVCYGNIYRSPFAHYYAKTVFPNSVMINSTGYFPRDKRRCHERAVDIALELGADMSEHRSSIITQEMVDKADIILVFDRYNRQTIIDKFPSAARKIYYTGALSYKGTVIINDPVMGNLYTVREIYKAIKRAIDSIW
ncbi:MAG: hypothetical protein J7K40_07810 [candidate division Zixibacteria bacterium]|nr:hypothetical protein [candidate division Zixibacteria bacterium]